MRYFTVHGSSSQEALAEMMRRYGPDACIQSHRTVRVGGVLGLFTRPAVEITGYVDGKTDDSADPQQPQPVDGEPRAGVRNAAAPILGTLLDEVTALRARTGRVAASGVGSDGAARRSSVSRRVASAACRQRLRGFDAGPSD